jgi:hypothetical protein
MARPDTPTLNRLAQANDGRSAITGEGSGAGYLGGLGESPVTSRRSIHQTAPRMPEKDTDNSYAYKTGMGRYALILKSKVDGE